MRYHTLFLKLALLLPALFGFASSTHAADMIFTYQGVITRTDSQPVDSTVSSLFILYRQESGGSSIASISDAFLPISENGLVTKELNFGEQGNDGLPIYFGGNLYLEIWIDGNPLNPRQRITPAPIASSIPGVFTLGSEVRVGSGYGSVVVGDLSTVTNMRLERGSIALPLGGICLDSDGDCTPPFGGIRVGIGGVVGADSTNNDLLLQPGNGRVSIGQPDSSEILASLHVQSSDTNQDIVGLFQGNHGFGTRLQLRNTSSPQAASGSWSMVGTGQNNTGGPNNLIFSFQDHD